MNQCVDTISHTIPGLAISGERLIALASGTEPVNDEEAAVAGALRSGWECAEMVESGRDPFPFERSDEDFETEGDLR
jgi:hypothetical protein